MKAEQITKPNQTKPNHTKTSQTNAIHLNVSIGSERIKSCSAILMKKANVHYSIENEARMK